MLIDETFRNCFCSPGKASDAPGHEQTGFVDLVQFFQVRGSAAV